MKILNLVSQFILTLFLLTGCGSDFLDETPMKSLLVPTTLTDFQALLDNAADVMNQGPVLNQFSDGDFVISQDGLPLQSVQVRNSYLWARDIYAGEASSDWDGPYKQVLYSNVVLEGLDKITPSVSDQKTHQYLKGAALFYRALAFYNLAQQFAVPYDSLTASQAPGIPIRLEADVTAVSVRGSLSQTYQRVVEDLLAAKDLLPVKQQVITRPGSLAATALLARVYLVMENYDKALFYAAAALSVDKSLLDYRSLAVSDANPFPIPFATGANPEILYFITLNSAINSNTAFSADSALYNSYTADDLRKTHFFNGDGNYKGSYTGGVFCFGGLANDELYLVQAECLARRGDLKASADILNQLLVTRFKAGSFKLLSFDSQQQALQTILSERRKELIARGTRWSDLRRLNKHASFETVIRRSYLGKTYQLTPNDKRYTLPIPDDEIIHSGISQNER